MKSYLEGAERLDITKEKEKEKPKYLANAEILEKPKGSGLKSAFKDAWDFTKNLDHQLAVLGSRGFEAIAGGPTDIANFAGRLAGAEKEVPFTEEESLEAGLQPGQGFKKVPKKASIQGVELPGSNEFREALNYLTGGYTEPKNENEEIAGNVASAVAGRRILPGNAFTRVVTPVAGETVKQTAKKYGIDDKESDWLKFGAEVVLDTTNLANAGRHVGELYQTARNEAQGLSLNAAPLQRAFDNLRNTWRREVRTHDNPANNLITQVEDAVTNGRIEATQLMDARRAVNAERNRLGHFLNTTDRVRGRQVLGELDTILNNALEQIASVQPRFLDTYRQASRGYAAIQQSNRIADWVSNNYTDKFLSSGAPLLFGAVAHAGPASTSGIINKIGTGAQVATGVYSAHKAIQIAERVIRSPELARYYANIMRLSSTPVLTEAARKKQDKEIKENVEKLDKGLYKQELYE